MVSVELTNDEVQNLINLLAGATVPMAMAENALKTLKTLEGSLSNGEKESTD